MLLYNVKYGIISGFSQFFEICSRLDYQSILVRINRHFINKAMTLPLIHLKIILY